MFSVLVVHPTPTPGLALTLSRLVEAALSGSLADVAIADLCGDPLAQRLSEDGGCALKRVACAPAQAIAQAITQAGAGDVVLIAGKGHEPYQDVGGIKHPFDDAQMAREQLRRHA